MHERQFDERQDRIHGHRRTDSLSASPATLLGLQRAAGNLAVRQLLDGVRARSSAGSDTAPPLRGPAPVDGMARIAAGGISTAVQRGGTKDGATGEGPAANGMAKAPPPVTSQSGVGDTAGATSASAGAGPVTAGSLPTGLPARLPDDDEAKYRTRGEQALSDLGGAVTSAGQSKGHTPGGPISGFPDWFGSLQDRLIASTEWRKGKEEAGQNLLAEYALKRFAVPFKGNVEKVPPTIRAYCQYIGRSTSNQKSAAAAGLPSTATIGGAEGAKMWCAAAGSSSVSLALESVGLTFATGADLWLRKPPVPAVGLPQAPTEAAIEPGDQVSYIGGGAPAIGGHTTTATSSSQGDGTIFLHASGNAGGGSSGSVRLGSSQPRAKPPGKLTFDDFSSKSPAELGAPKDKLWIYIIVKYSQLWSDLGAIDTSGWNHERNHAKAVDGAEVGDLWTSGAGAAFCKKYKLKRRPVSA